MITGFQYQRGSAQNVLFLAYFSLFGYEYPGNRDNGLQLIET